MARGRYLAMTLLTIGPMACSADEPSAMEYANPLDAELAETLRIGSADDPDQALTRIGAVLALPDGGVWIAQPADQEVRIHGADGSFVRSVGRRGEGPGEFAALSGLGWWRGHQDTVWVADQSLRRISLFTRDGVFARTLASSPVEYRDTFTITQPAIVAPDGIGIALAAYRTGSNEWHNFPLIRYDVETGIVRRELTRLDGTSSVLISWQGQAIATGMRPFSSAPIVTYSPAADRILIVDRPEPLDESGARIQTTLLSPTGDTLWTRHFRYRAEAIPQAELDSVFDQRIASFQQFARLERRLSEREAEQAYRASVPAPRFRPPINAARISGEGSIWLEWNAAPSVPRHWWLLDSDGDPLATVRHAHRLDVRAAGRDFLWVAETDSLDVPYLVRYRVLPERRDD